MVRVSASVSNTGHKVANRDEILDHLADLLKIADYEDLGPNGLQVPGGIEVGRVATGVSAHLELFRAAAEVEANLLITHHGLFWDFLPRSLSAQMKDRLAALFEADISLAVFHLPLDAHRSVGNNALLCERLGFELDPAPFGDYRGQAIGAIGRSQSGVPIDELKARIEAELGQTPLIFSEGPELVRRIGFVSGAGAGNFAEAVSLGLDAFLTGEPAEHVMAEARESDTHFIAAGHYATEKFGVQRLGELIAERFGVEHVFLDFPNPV